MKRLTDSQKKVYLKGGGVKCPFCGSTDITGGFVEIEEGGAFQKVSCPCGRSWIDVYSLVDIKEEGGK